MNKVNEDNYIVINPDVIDREFQENEAIEKIGKQFLFKKDMPYTIDAQMKLEVNYINYLRVLSFTIINISKKSFSFICFLLVLVGLTPLSQNACY